MILSAYEQEALLTSKEGRRANFGFLKGDIETRTIGGRSIKGKGEALSELDKLIQDWNKRGGQQVHVNSGYRTREEQFREMRLHPEIEYGDLAKRYGVTMHSTGQAFDITAGGRHVPKGFAEFARQRGFIQTVDNDALHFVYNGGKNAVSSYTGFNFTSDVSSAIRQASREIGVDENIMRAFAHIESGGKTGAKSGTGVRGLFQITGDTWASTAPGVAYSTDALTQSRVAGTLVKNLIKKYDGNLDLAAVAYNAGDKVADRAKELMGKGHGIDTAIDMATRETVRGGKYFSQKTLNKYFQGSVDIAADRKSQETVNYRKRFRAALEGHDWTAIRDYETTQRFESAAQEQRQDVAGKGADEKAENIAEYLFTKKFGICENSLRAIAAKPEATEQIVGWLREKGLVNA